MGTSLDCRNAEACGAISSEANILKEFEAITLPGAIELFGIAVNTPDESHIRCEIRAAAREGISPWVQLVSAWNRPVTRLRHDLAARLLEFRKLPCSLPSVDEDSEELAFEQRFRSSLLQNGFPPDFARGMAAVLHEMMDNVRQHSSRGSKSAQAIVGYHAENRYFSFSVSDAGQGFLGSLTQSPEWAHLQDEAMALRAVVCENASRRTGQGPGEGFKSLFKILVDHGALVRLRSRGTVANVGLAPDGRRMEMLGVSGLIGCRVAVCCRLGAETVEAPIIFS